MTTLCRDVSLECAQVKPQGMQWLSQIVAGGCNESILRFSFLVATGQFLKRGRQLEFRCMTFGGECFHTLVGAAQ